MPQPTNFVDFLVKHLGESTGKRRGYYHVPYYFNYITQTANVLASIIVKQAKQGKTIEQMQRTMHDCIDADSSTGKKDPVEVQLIKELSELYKKKGALEPLESLQIGAAGRLCRCFDAIAKAMVENQFKVVSLGPGMGLFEQYLQEHGVPVVGIAPKGSEYDQERPRFLSDDRMIVVEGEGDPKMTPKNAQAALMQAMKMLEVSDLGSVVLLALMPPMEDVGFAHYFVQAKPFVPEGSNLKHIIFSEELGMDFSSSTSIGPEKLFQQEILALSSPSNPIKIVWPESHADPLLRQQFYLSFAGLNDCDQLMKDISQAVNSRELCVLRLDQPSNAVQLVTPAVFKSLGRTKPQQASMEFFAKEKAITHSLTKNPQLNGLQVTIIEYMTSGKNAGRYICQFPNGKMGAIVASNLRRLPAVRQSQSRMALCPDSLDRARELRQEMSKPEGLGASTPSAMGYHLSLANQP